MVTRNMLGTQCKQSHGHKWYNNLTFCATFMFCDIKRDCFDDIGKERLLHGWEKNTGLYYQKDSE